MDQTYVQDATECAAHVYIMVEEVVGEGKKLV
jgi:hypothetical protein